MFSNFIKKGALVGAKTGLLLATIYAILVSLIVGASTHSWLGIGYSFFYLLVGIFVGVLPSGLLGAFSGMVVGTLVYLEQKYLTRLGVVRLILWRTVGVIILIGVVIGAVHYINWILYNPMLVLMDGMYFGGLVWLILQFYRQNSELSKFISVKATVSDNTTGLKIIKRNWLMKVSGKGRPHTRSGN